MASSKISDGIRKKGETLPARGGAPRDEPRPVSFPPAIPESRADAAASVSPPRSPARRAADIVLSPKSDFLAHWGDDRKSSDEYDRIESTSEDAQEDAEAAGELVSAPAGAQEPISWSEIDEPPLASPRRLFLRALPALPASAGTRMARWGIATGAVVLVAGMIFISTAGASLTVSFKSRVEDIALQDIAVAFDTSVGKVLPAQKVIPAESLSFLKSKEQSFPATGRQVIAERALGKAVITNSFSSSSQTLVAGTRFLTDAGVLFRLPKSVTVPGATIEAGKIAPQSVETDLVADAPGERSNIAGAMALKIPGLKGTPKYDGFAAIASHGFSGGMQGTASVVSADDLKKAEEQVTKAVFDDLHAEMARKIPPGFTALPELQSIEMTKVIAPAVGARAEQFSVSADAAGRVIVFRAEDALALVAGFAITDGSQELVDGAGQLQYHSRSIDFDKGRADMTIGGSIKTKAVVHQDELASLVAGKKSGSIADVLRARPEIANFTLSLFPPWRASAPSDPAKIHFHQE